MDKFKILSIYPINTDYYSKYTSIADDNDFFYIVNISSYRIDKYNRQFEFAGYIKISKMYNSICYDSKEKCFWGAYDIEDKIYKLNNNFEEINHISIHCKENLGHIKSMSVDVNTNQLFIAYCKYIVQIDKSNPNKIFVKQKSDDKTYTGITSLYEGYIITFNKNQKNYLIIYSDNNKIVAKFELPKQYDIENIISCYCAEKCYERYKIYILASKASSNYLLECELNSTSNTSNDYNDSCYDLCDYDCDCNYDEEHEHENGCNNKEHYIDIIKSIALIEASIADILKAESRKIEKILDTTDNILDILETNKQVNKTIVNIIHLEQILYSKLQLASENHCCEDDYDIEISNYLEKLT